MGADFLVAMIDIYGDVDTVKARVDAMTDEQILKWATNTGEFFPDRYIAVDGFINHSPDELREEIKIIIEEFVGTREARDLAAWPLDRNQGWRYISGGMSAGDSPTEAFDDIVLLSYLPLSVLGGASVAMTLPEAFDLLALIESDSNRDSTLDNVEQQLIDQIYEDGRE